VQVKNVFRFIFTERFALWFIRRLRLARNRQTIFSYAFRPEMFIAARGND